MLFKITGKEYTQSTSELNVKLFIFINIKREL